MAALTIIAPSDSLQAQQNDSALSQALSGLNVRSFKAKTAAVISLGELGDPRAVAALEALSEGRLYSRKLDNAVVVGDRDGKAYKLTDPLSGASAGDAGSRDLKKIVANNKLRGIIRGVLGQLALSSPDKVLRGKAVEDVIARPTAGALALLKRARDRETEDDIRARLETGIAALELGAA
ncbi:MAG: urea ABC transporter permease subunit UrtB, partial [Alphaproteobacteria bacterium]